MSADTPLLQLVIDALEEVKAQNITPLDVREITSVADNMVIEWYLQPPRESPGRQRGRCRQERRLPADWYRR